eukprot:CAMPEP_0119542782 /NCGR_PEP_ID=MMETSP1344-20130328/53778_1 /TAXON_ID=236787 /ORGANISM="Florenciella parvula, Strain CCMP2471" /LENGTH=260 /DNA_ID=CAMNT_0007587041 /DNA_START=26 /DNA_END=808 /DNA_ORIENTATION=+
MALRHSLCRVARPAVRIPSIGAYHGIPPLSSNDDAQRSAMNMQAHQMMLSRNFSAAVGMEGVKPTLDVAKEMPREYYEMSNKLIVKLSIAGDEDAVAERLTREVMYVDSLDYEAALAKLKAIDDACNAGKTLNDLPYKAGALTAYVAALASIPLCFHLDTCLWFNEGFVTTEVAEAKDLETWLEVGSWSWTWMEPPLGQISFFLLCLQMARQQMVNVGIKPFGERTRVARVQKVVAAFPQYQSEIVEQYAGVQVGLAAVE